MLTLTPALHDTIDFAIDFATLGEYGLLPSPHAAPARGGASGRPATIHRVCASEGRSAAARGLGADPRVAPATAAARRSGRRGAERLLAAQALERQRRLGASTHARRPPVPVVSLDEARKRHASRPSQAPGGQLTFDLVA